MGQLGFWDWEKRHEHLQGLARQYNVLMQLKEMIAWEEFRPILEQVHIKERKSLAGRKPWDVVLMFKLLIVQKLYNISDEQLEYQVNDRLSFMEFLDLGVEDKVPDKTTVWLFRQRLIEMELIEELFERFEQYLQEQGYEAQGGQIVDASIVPVPKQHNTREENEQIKQGQVPQEWESKPHKLAQKDTEARWTRKNNQNFYGYKNHTCIDVENGFIRTYEVTDAAVHDSQVLGAILDARNEGDGLWGDSAYRSKSLEKALSLMGFESHINERGYRNHPLTEQQKACNRERSSVRAKVEHVFGRWVNEMGGKLVRAVGYVRVKAHLGLTNLTYNLKRFVMLETRCG